MKMEAEMKQYHKRGLWTEEEDRTLQDHIKLHGIGHWNRIPKLTGLKRCGKSCRLRWLNYLSPNVKRGCFSEEEEDLIIRLHKLLGNRWALIAGRVPGRTDNQVKNHWNTHLRKKLGFASTKLINQSRKSLFHDQVIISDNNSSDHNPQTLINNNNIEIKSQEGESNCNNVNEGKAYNKEETELTRSDVIVPQSPPLINMSVDGDEFSDIIMSNDNISINNYQGNSNSIVEFLDEFCNVPQFDDHLMYYHYF